MQQVALAQKCIIENIPLAAVKADVSKLLSNFKLKSVKLVKEEGASSQSAIVNFKDNKDYPQFAEQYHQAVFLGSKLAVAPYSDDKVRQTKQ